MSSVHEEKAPEGPKAHVRELRNTELVSRLLAATPPYLYGALPLQPHAFFFSEMLRSFVNARHGCRPPHYHRRFKRRTQKYFAENETEWNSSRREWPKQEEEKKESETRPEVPLELTVEKHTRVRETSPTLSPKCDQKSASPVPPGRQSSFVDVGTEELPKPSPCVGRNSEAAVPSNLILPPPPPMWYPPLYNPQFGVDPLNFFIDLRVSGHIYDRKRTVAEGMDTSQEVRDDSGLDKRLNRDFGQRPRHMSAFSVPVRSTIDSEKYFDRNAKETGRNQGTSYIMKNLKRVYENVHNAEDVKMAARVTKDEDAKIESSDVEDDIVD